ncbi:hypothetical protein BHE74_00028868 [Ensete ventricosum]|nr:hypothetical protein BHE74_00028868 [Ensete ventricosum]
MLNQDAPRNKVTTRSTTHRPSTPSTINRPSQLKELMKKEHRDRSVRGLCRHYDEHWSRDHHCKKGRLLMIEPIEEPKHKEENLEAEENTMEDQQLTECTTHSPVDYTNPQIMKVEVSLKQQPVTILTDTRSFDNLMNTYWMDIKFKKKHISNQEEGIITSTIYRSKRGITCRAQQNMVAATQDIPIHYNEIITPLTMEKDAPLWPRKTSAPIATMPSISMLPFSNCDKMFMIRVNTSGVGTGAALMQDGRSVVYIKALPSLHMRLLSYNVEILIAVEFEA